ncbi:UNVERIFIED_CONTAM: hypothetical protein K2H54_040544 [Gekko kuhli]
MPRALDMPLLCSGGETWDRAGVSSSTAVVAGKRRASFTKSAYKVEFLLARRNCPYEKKKIQLNLSENVFWKSANFTIAVLWYCQLR